MLCTSDQSVLSLYKWWCRPASGGVLLQQVCSQRGIYLSSLLFRGASNVSFLLLTCLSASIFKVVFYLLYCSEDVMAEGGM